MLTLGVQMGRVDIVITGTRAGWAVIIIITATPLIFTPMAIVPTQMSSLPGSAYLLEKPLWAMEKNALFPPPFLLPIPAAQA